MKICHFFVLCDIEIWWVTLKNNRAPLLWYFKLCASFRSHRSIQTGVTVRKCQMWVKISNFLFRETLKFDAWPWKIIGHLFYATSSFVHHFIDISQFKDLLHGHHFCQWQSFLKISWWYGDIKHSEKGVTDRRRDGQTDGRTAPFTIHRAAWLQLKIIIAIQAQCPVFISALSIHQRLLNPLLGWRLIFNDQFVYFKQLLTHWSLVTPYGMM